MLESIEKLRDYTLCDERGMHTIYEPSDRIADEIEREIAERYMPLPVDADGVPIHVGDELETANGGKVIVDYVGECKVRVYRDGEHYRFSQDDYACTCRHVKSRTVEDVLCDVWNEALDYANSDMWRDPSEVFAERADEIRELLGGDAE